MPHCDEDHRERCFEGYRPVHDVGNQVFSATVECAIIKCGVSRVLIYYRFMLRNTSLTVGSKHDSPDVQVIDSAKASLGELSVRYPNVIENFLNSDIAYALQCRFAKDGCPDIY